MPHIHPELRKPINLNKWVRGHCKELQVNYGVCPRLQSNKCSTYSKNPAGSLGMSSPRGSSISQGTLVAQKHLRPVLRHLV